MSRECDSASEKENCKGTCYHVTLYLGGKKTCFNLPFYFSKHKQTRDAGNDLSDYSDLNSTYFSVICVACLG
jgi:hypothetical protein